ncbi:fungal-specific transcription factor domain-containing protein [Kalaharituber pfeilii]|nr:fungal-specific transcription factor domain-containing protein [Kalaharituber pfeilii]
MPPKRQAPMTTTPVTGVANANGMNSSIEFQSAEEFTRTVKRKLSSSTRTGQACDRCKVRKIRCDGLPGGCSPCIQNRTECRTTDRISQRAMPRGYVESLEAKCASMEARMKELEAALALERSSRGEHSSEGLMNGNGQKHEQPHTRNEAGVASEWYYPINGVKPKTYLNSTRDARIHPQLRNGTGPPDDKVRGFRPGCYYLGLSSGSSTLHTMKDTALSVLGIEIDLSDVDPVDTSYASMEGGMNDSYASLLNSMFNVNPSTPQKLELPPKAEGMACAQWFYSFSYPYLPIVHWPTFAKQLERMYDERDYRPTTGVLIQAHMMVAICYFQTGTRDRTASTTTSKRMEKSFEHYHFSLTHFYSLLRSASIEDLQALCMIIQHIRSFPKPGASWFLARIVMSLAMELGLHRSSKKWHTHRRQNCIEDEMRKRVWWCIWTVETSLCAKLGRPMCLTEADYDIELPERVDDEYLTADGYLTRPEGVKGCSFDVGIEFFKVIPLYVEINSTLYAVVRPSRDKYVELVEQLEKRLIVWRDQIPEWISQDSQQLNYRYQALSLDVFFHECRILMRHPSLSLSPSPIFNKHSVKMCVESSREILRLTDKLRRENSYMDATWYTITVQLLATLTILFSMWKDGDQEVAQEEIDQVKADMELCQEIMGDIGTLVGSSDRLRDIVRRLTQGTLEYLYQRQRKNKLSANSKPSRPLPGSAVPTLGPSSPSYYMHSNIVANYVPPPTPISATKLNSQLLSPLDADRSNRIPSPSQQHYPSVTQTSQPSQQQPYALDPLSMPENSPYSSANSYPSHPATHPSVFPWSYPGSDWAKYAEYVSTIGMDTGSHTPSLVQAGLAGLMTLSGDNSLLNAAVAAVAASRAEDPGDQVGSAAGEWGTMGLGVGLGSGGYSLAGAESNGRSSAGVDAGGN